MKTFSFFIAALLCSTAAICQSVPAKPAHKLSFSSINQVGLLTGGSGQAATVQTINGVIVNEWFVGVGTGIDYYGSRGIPLFIDVRRNLKGKTGVPFLYADAGVHFPWLSKVQDANKNYIIEDHQAGAYLDGGVGIKLQTKHIGAVLLSAGYSYKKVTDKAQMFFIWSGAPLVPAYEYYNYTFRRIVIKVGIQL